MSHMNNDDQNKEDEAANRAKKIKGFYRSLMFFVLVNLFLLINYLLPPGYNNGYFWFLIIWAFFLIYQALNFWIFNGTSERQNIKKIQSNDLNKQSSKNDK
jgi:hypothetical protein